MLFEQRSSATLHQTGAAREVDPDGYSFVLSNGTFIHTTLDWSRLDSVTGQFKWAKKRRNGYAQWRACRDHSNDTDDDDDDDGKSIAETDIKHLVTAPKDTNLLHTME